MSQKQVKVVENPQPGNFVKVEQAPIPEINDDQIQFKAVAFAANPTDWKHALFGWAKGGDAAGCDASGIVTKVGKNVKNFAEGDYVSAVLHGSTNPHNAAFSEYVVSEPSATIKYDKSSITDKKLSVGTHPSGPIDSFEGAASITLSLGTVGLSFSNNLKLSYDKAENAKKYILIWGGATAAGVAGIQLAKLVYGINVITTASKANHEFLKSLGADHVFDYKDADVVEQIKKAGQGKIYYALDTVSTKETFQQVYDATEGADEVAIDNLLFLGESSLKTKEGRKVIYYNTIVYLIDGKPHPLGDAELNGDEELYANFNKLWQEVLPEYLPKFKTSNLRVLAPGLESANEAYSLLQENKINNAKVVFHI